MILGKIKDLNRYKGISTEIDQAIEYVLKTDLLNLEIGRYELSEDVIVNRQAYFGKELAQAETHKKFIDLQIVVKGKEGFGYSDITNPTLVTKIDYNEETDVEFYDVCDELIYTLAEGSFAIVFPEDVHRPGMKLDEEMIEKVVLKIKVK